MNELSTFSNFSGLKPSITKCEIVGTGVLNGVQVALFGIKCVNLNSENVKIQKPLYSGHFYSGHLLQRTPFLSTA